MFVSVCSVRVVLDSSFRVTLRSAMSNVVGTLTVSHRQTGRVDNGNRHCGERRRACRSLDSNRLFVERVGFGGTRLKRSGTVVSSMSIIASFELYSTSVYSNHVEMIS